MDRASDGWDGVVRLRGASLADLARRHGGQVRGDPGVALRAIARVEDGKDGDLAPFLAARFATSARLALERGAVLLADASVAASVLGGPRLREGARLWVHEHAAWAMAGVLEDADVPEVAPIVGAQCEIGAGVFLGPRVRIGDRVRIGPGAVVGYPGFGWATGPGGAVRALPQLGGVVVDDDVAVGPLTTIDAGTLAPTRIGAGTKLDAHVHVGHNVRIGSGTFVAAQCGFAGSVRIGERVLVGGQVGIADHVVVGDRARIAAKSGVIGDVPAGAVVAGYPAVARGRWLRALARLYRARGAEL